MEKDFKAYFDDVETNLEALESADLGAWCNGNKVKERRLEVAIGGGEMIDPADMRAFLRQGKEIQLQFAIGSRSLPWSHHETIYLPEQVKAPYKDFLHAIHPDIAEAIRTGPLSMDQIIAHRSLLNKQIAEVEDGNKVIDAKAQVAAHRALAEDFNKSSTFSDVREHQEEQDKEYWWDATLDIFFEELLEEGLDPSGPLIATRLAEKLLYDRRSTLVVAPHHFRKWLEVTFPVTSEQTELADNQNHESDKNEFILCGEIWNIRFNGRLIQMEDCVPIKTIAECLAHPHQEKNLSIKQSDPNIPAPSLFSRGQTQGANIILDDKIQGNLERHVKSLHKKIEETGLKGLDTSELDRKWEKLQDLLRSNYNANLLDDGKIEWGKCFEKTELSKAKDAFRTNLKRGVNKIQDKEDLKGELAQHLKNHLLKHKFYTPLPDSIPWDVKM